MGPSSAADPADDVAEFAGVSRDDAVVALKWAKNNVQIAVQGIIQGKIAALRKAIPWPVGSFVDMRDSNGDWYQARIVKHVGKDSVRGNQLWPCRIYFCEIPCGCRTCHLAW